MIRRGIHVTVGLFAVSQQTWCVINVSVNATSYSSAEHSVHIIVMRYFSDIVIVVIIFLSYANREHMKDINCNETEHEIIQATRQTTSFYAHMRS